MVPKFVLGFELASIRKRINNFIRIQVKTVDMSQIIWVIWVLHDKLHILAQIITSRNCCRGKLQLQSGDGYIRVPNEYITLKRFNNDENHQTQNNDNQFSIQHQSFCSINIPGMNLKTYFERRLLGLKWGRLAIVHHSDPVYVQSYRGPHGAVWHVSAVVPGNPYIERMVSGFWSLIRSTRAWKIISLLFINSWYNKQLLVFCSKWNFWWIVYCSNGTMRWWRPNRQIR